MKTRELASDKLKKERADAHKYAMEEARSDNKAPTQQTDMFKCFKCKNDNAHTTSYKQEVLMNQ
eukprot:TRINITY_DN14034_c0_g1_i1.p2 TRINITY_DN14034_c0_g1~~TRINITY_DN14034_c0_g1_i1.p2  ORF type:complete len:64 (+),score=18.70 TRINITY_DN14034_c0_g1_i1:61-252(+)